MKSPPSLSCSSCLKSALLIVQLALGYGISMAAVQAAGLDYRTELPQGYLTVYSATDRFDDGGVPYYVHISYSIYTSDGKLFKKVENHVSLSDETPDLVTLPAGSYAVAARSESGGYVRVPVVIAAGRRTVIDLEGQQTDTQRKLGRGKHSQCLANQ